MGRPKDDVVFFRMDTPSQLENEYQFGPKLGEGTFGVVYRGIRKNDNAKCAIKKILRERTYSVSERARLDREICILRLVRHPGIIALFAVAESPSILFLITELCEGSSLDHCLEKLPPKVGLEEHIAAEIIRQVASSLSYLHNRGIVHRDLKAGNIMLLHEVKLEPRRMSLDDPGESLTTSVPPTVQLATFSLEIKRSGLSPYELGCPKEINSITPNSGSVARAPTRSITSRNRSKRSAPENVVGKQTRESSSKKVPTITPSTAGIPKLSTPVLLSTSAVPRPSVSAGSPATIQVKKYPPASLRTKLIDFGLAIEVKKNEEALDNQCGTPLYMAPEVLMGRSYTRQCDVWSLGILMHQLLTNRLPFNAQTEEQLLESIAQFDPLKVTRQLKYVSDSGKDCLAHVLHMDPAYRYSASELLLDRWLAQFPSASPTDELNHLELVPDLQSRAFQRISAETFTEMSTKGNPGSNHVSDLKVIQAGQFQTDGQKSSSGFGNTGSTHSATNVLELMKQYHKELAEMKQDGAEQQLEEHSKPMQGS